MLIPIVSYSKQITGASNTSVTGISSWAPEQETTTWVGVNNSERRIFQELNFVGVTFVLHLSAVDGTKKNI